MRKIDQLNKLEQERKQDRVTVEQLCNEWGWTLSDKEVQVSNELVAENERLIDENMELERQITFKDGQIFSLENTIKELKAQIEELKDNKLYNIVKEKVEGDDAMEQPKAQPKKTEKDRIAEEHAKYGRKVVKDTVIIDKNEGNGFIHGQIKINKNYVPFTASGKLDSVVLAGITDDKIKAEAKEILINEGHGDIFVGYGSTGEERLHAIDKENKIEAFCEDGVFYGYVDGKYYFVWNPAYDAPTACLITNMKKTNRRLRKMDNSWGALFEERARRVMEFCENNLRYINYTRLEKEAEMGISSTPAFRVTNEVVVDTKDTDNNTNDIAVMTEEEAADAL